ncbi:NADPH-dependent FMN reductase [Robiginitalea marina]|uniref:NAD(P)H-dependent oxidoreductase n=1 Tax=Robiginitalea marina TaxID=2954105 RepID=A0ABT1ATW9_9FLAO|nr:NAD(P)H-dependent oxidoreductase [Robiginitalea marina]MCO5723423.1 NAD(P)H-dependent oxidoreductase [Robiginitalea marina]
MSPILATAGSNSSTSINYQLVKYTAGLAPEGTVKLMELARHSYPMYSEDLEKEQGIPGAIKELLEDLRECRGLILSVNEHNGNPSAFFKNILDWLSRADRNFMADTPVLLMSASGGKRGASGSLAVVEQMLPRFGATIVSTFSLPSYYENFDPESGITGPELRQKHQSALNAFLSALD